MPPKISRAAFEALAAEGVPFMAPFGCRVECLEHGRCDVRMPFHEALLRPGGTMSGPAMMALADIALYGVVLSMIGRFDLVVTTNLSFNFLRKAPPGDLLGHGRILKLGRSLAVGEVTVTRDEDARAIAHAVGTYAIPQAIAEPDHEAG